MTRIALLVGLLLAVGACSPAEQAGTTTTPAPAEPTTSIADTTTTTSADSTTTTEGPADFPVTVADDLREVTVEERPEAIVSLSSTATEMLFAIGAGEQVVAVDEFSTYPPEAPITDLSGFTPNVEAILGYEPDLVVISFDPADLQSSLDAVGVPSIVLHTATSLNDSYRQLEVLGAATGHVAEAAMMVAMMQADIDAIVSGAGSVEGLSFFHEVDETLFAASSTSFLGQVYAMFGLENIADGVEDEGGRGFPQLSSEYIVAEDPDLIFLADADFGVTPESLAERPGWDGMKAVQDGAIIEVDTYLSSNWGPRVVEFVQLVADALSQYAPVT